MKLIPPTGDNLRADCAWVIFSILEHGVSAKKCLPMVLSKYDQARDRNWLNETSMGILRNLPLLQSWLRPMLSKPLKGEKKIIEHLLLVGFYQLEFMRTSSHAATNETVEACSILHASALRGLVNGILRKFQRMETPPAKSEAMGAGLPGWIMKRLKSAYPDNYVQIMDAMNSKPPVWLRVNTQRTDTKRYQDNLVASNIHFTTSPGHPEAIILTKGDITQLPGFVEGLFSVQDGAAQLAAHIVNPQPHEHILDCCAAPGGKTSHLFALEPLAHITAVEIDPARLGKTNDNMARLGAKANIIQGDACKPEEWWDSTLYDRILVDAPCSASGIIRRQPDIRWLRKSTDMKPLVDIQANTLDQTWPLLKPGGTLVYATCSIFPEENGDQIDAFLSRTQDALIDGINRQILPGEEQMDGFYYARLVKSKT